MLRLVTPLQDEAEETAGGDPVCWAHLVCDECGAITTEGHRDGCAKRMLGGREFGHRDGGQADALKGRADDASRDLGLGLARSTRDGIRAAGTRTVARGGQEPMVGLATAAVVTNPTAPRSSWMTHCPAATPRSLRCPQGWMPTCSPCGSRPR